MHQHVLPVNFKTEPLIWWIGVIRLINAVNCKVNFKISESL